jgi:hypothetical protein
MKNQLKTILAGAILLLFMQTAQAVPMVGADQDFGVVGFGSDFKTGVLPDIDNNLNILWFKFTLAGLAGPVNVSLDTAGSTFVDPDDDDDTLLALYDVNGDILSQNDDCTSGGPLYFSCLDATLDNGMFFAGIVNVNGEFFDDFLATTEQGTGDITLNLSVSPVPVPAAVWLFGTALIGFVGMSRRTSVKS